MGLVRLMTTPVVYPLQLVGRPLARQLDRWHLARGGDDAKRRRQAQRLASTLLSEFHRLGFTRRVVTGKKKRQKQRVRFEYPLLMTHDELWCPIDLKRLPQGVRTDDLRDEAVLNSLQDRCHVGVRPDYLANGKLCFVMRLGGSQFPETFSINKFEMPLDALALAVPFGIDANGDQVAVNLIELKHLLIAGATGGGKTTIQHAMISTLISRNTADEVELWLLDLKRTEFNLYRPLMGKKGEGGIVKHIAVEPEKCIELLDSAYKEITRRNQLMERMGATNIHDLASMTGQRLKRIVLIFDEFAILTTDTTKIGKQTVGKWGTLLMTRIAALGRSAGVTIVIATQFVNKEVLSSSIRANFENRLTFSTADWRQSQLVVETSEADGLPPGRAILRREGKTSELQTCLITPRQVRLEVARIAEFGPDGGLGDRDELAQLVRDAKLLLDAACQQFNGDFSRNKLLALDGVRGLISQERFNEVAQRLEREGVLEPGKGKRPRQVVRGFFGRPGLLDSLFGLAADEINGDNTANSTANSTQTAESAGESQLGKNDVLFGRQNGQDGAKGGDELAVCGLESSDTHGVEREEEDSELLDPFRRLFGGEPPETEPDGEEES